MQNTLSLRSYTNQNRSHLHKHHQLVLPIKGAIEINIAGYSGKVSVGDCVIIKAEQRHDFKAHEAARFIVADLEHLPDNINHSGHITFAINKPLLCYLQFVEKQLEDQVNPELEQVAVHLFYQLLAQQSCQHHLDPRIKKVLAAISENLADKILINELAKIACLSPTQFKKVFKQDLGQSVQQYITALRMDKARTLLTHTDLPIKLIAEQVGYNDLSAFSRRFSIHFQQSPREFSR